MVEEWRLSAHDTAKRIMIRQCMRDAARMVGENKRLVEFTFIVGNE
jgi:hypothetical protein